MMTEAREARVAECLVPANTYAERVSRGNTRRAFAEDLAEALVTERWRREHVDRPVIEAASALLEALRRQECGLANLTHRARCAVSDLLIALDARGTDPG